MKKTVLFLVFLLFSLPIALQAQMFSVGDDDRFRSNPFAPYIRAGIKAVDFSYQGAPNSPEAGTLNMNEIAAHIAFESGGFNLSASLANQLIGVNDRNYFDLNISFLNPFILIRSPNLIAGVPLRLGSSVTSVRNDDTSNEFSQTNLSAGLGGLVQFHFPELLGGTLQFIPSYGFSSSSGGFVGGNVFSLHGKARLNFYNLIFGKNLSLGYDYNFDTFDIDGEELDYDFTGHSLTLGISF